MGNANKSKRDSNACVLEKSLDLSDEEMNDYPIDGLKEVLIVQNGKIQSIYP